MQIVSPPCWIKRLMNEKLIWEIPTSKKELFLTFDDGPTTELTVWILNTLKTYNAKATFFCVGNNVSKHPKLFNQILEEGHAVGNHTYNHEKGFRTTTIDYIRSVRKCKEVVQSNLFRPPHGRIKPQQIQVLQAAFKIILWSTLTYDFDKSITPEQCYSNSIKNSKAGSIIVFHDNVKSAINMQYALPLFLEYFTNQGYTFNSIKL